MSLDIGESLAGTAVEETTRWLLLELPGPWAAKPLMSAGLSETLRAHIQSVLDSTPGTRLQLIRRAGKTGAGLKLLVVRSGASGGWVHEVQLGDLTELLEVDIPALWKRRPESVAGPLILVCTHGMRDPCCAKAGAPLAHALTLLRPDAIWQTSHLGGHRFAATAVVLPWGVHLGRLEAADAQALVDSVDAGRIHRLDRYRGCTEWSKTAQAAEIYLRERDDLMAMDALDYIGGEGLGGDRVEERFQTPSGEVGVWVDMAPAGPPRLKSCGADVLSLPVTLRCRPAGS